MDNQEEKSFAELMAESTLGKDLLRPGQKVLATIVKISPEWIFIDLGSKSEGYIDKKEFIDPEGNLTVQEGDKIGVFFLAVKNGEKLFTRKIGRGEAAKAHLEEAWRNGIPLEGKISRETKGGLEVMIAGDVRAFCPYSLTGFPKGENVADYLGKTLPFKIIEYGENGRKVIISHRALLDEERTKRKEELKLTLQEGMVVQGQVMSLHNFGAFVDIGGIQGLLPNSEFAWQKDDDMSRQLAVGDLLSLAILKLDWAADKITLSRKATLPDPWSATEGLYPQGARLRGRVASLTNFGAFVTLPSGLEGLIHISKLAKGKRIKHANEVLTKGQELEVIVESMDSEKKRLSLTMATAEPEAAEGKEDGKDYLQEYQDAGTAATFGSFGDALKAKYASKPRR